MMWVSKYKMAARNAIVDARIKELENIICPAGQHDYTVVSEEMHVIDGYGTTIYTRQYVCKKCLKAIKKDDYV